MIHFLNIDDYNKTELRKILNFSKKIKKKQHYNSLLLKNKSLGMLFEKQSARTRLSFVIGMQKLGGIVIELDRNQIGFGKRETHSDLLKVMSQYLDVLAIRNNNHEEINYLASLNIMPIINGLSDFSHPCQVLSDIFTIEEYLGNIKNKNITWLGDFNNVLVSLIQSAEVFEFNLNILVPQDLKKNFTNIFKNKKLKFSKFYDNFDLGLKNCDCVMTDVWISMGEKNKKNKKKLLKKFQVNKDIMKKAKPSAIFMHCLPVHRNEEVTDDVIDGKQSVVWRQAQNRLFVQQSILNYLLNYEKK